MGPQSGDIGVHAVILEVNRPLKCDKEGPPRATVVHSSSSVIPIILHSPPLRPHHQTSHFINLLDYTLINDDLVSLKPAPPTRKRTVTDTAIARVLSNSRIFVRGRQTTIGTITRHRRQIEARTTQTSLHFGGKTIIQLSHGADLIIKRYTRIGRNALLIGNALGNYSIGAITKIENAVCAFNIASSNGAIVRIFRNRMIIRHPARPLRPTVSSLRRRNAPASPNSATGPRTVSRRTPPTGRGFSNSARPGNGPLRDCTLKSDASTNGLLKSELGPGSDLSSNHILDPLTRSHLGRAIKRPARPGHNRPSSHSNPSVVLAPEIRNRPRPPPPRAMSFARSSTVPIIRNRRVMVGTSGGRTIVSSLATRSFVSLLRNPFIQKFIGRLPNVDGLHGIFRHLCPQIPLPFNVSIPVPLPHVHFPFWNFDEHVELLHPRSPP